MESRGKRVELIDTVTHSSLYSCLYATHQRNRAILLLVVEEERTMRKPADKVITPVLLANPVLSHADIIPKTRLLYQLLEFTHFFKATAIHLFSMSRFQSISAMMTFFLASMNYPRSQDQFHECEKSVAFLLCFPVYYRLP